MCITIPFIILSDAVARPLQTLIISLSFYAYMQNGQHNKVAFCSVVLAKDTVLISISVPWWPWHVEQHKPRIVGFVDYDLVQLHSRMHSPHIGLIPAWHKTKVQTAGSICASCHKEF